MKTTLNLNDQIFQQAKGRAARDGITLTRFVEDALSAKLMNMQSKRAPFKLKLKTVSGNKAPDLDISDRDALYGIIDHT